MKHTMIRAPRRRDGRGPDLCDWHLGSPAHAAETCFGLTPTIVGTEGDVPLEGTAGDDVIFGLGGNGPNALFGWSGVDTCRSSVFTRNCEQ